MNILKIIRQIDITSNQVMANTLGGISLGGALFHTMPAALLTGLFRVDGEYEAHQKVRDLNTKISQILEVQSGIQKNMLEGGGTPEQLALKHNMLLMIEGVYRHMAQSLKKNDDGLQP